MNARHQIIDFSVQIEYNISMFISAWLEIDRDNSRSFGTSSQRLSFNNQINLVLDMGVMDKEQVKKMECFAQIRNKFAHVVEVKTFNECLNSNKNLKRTVNSLYPVNKFSDEELRAFQQMTMLLTDVTIIVDMLIEKLKKK
jgi:hypothetical protein